MATQALQRMYESPAAWIIAPPHPPQPNQVVEQPEDLEGCEQLIEGSSLKQNFLRIGQALVTVNDRRLYKKAGCSSFTQYIEQKSDFGFGPRQALRLLAATRLVRNFPPTIALPTSERQVSSLLLHTFVPGCQGAGVPQRVASTVHHGSLDVALRALLRDARLPP